MFYWHGEIDRVTEDAAVGYAESLLNIQQEVGEAPLDAVFVWRTKGGDMQACEGIQSTYGRLEGAGIRVWTVADGEALSAGSHLVAAGTPGCRFAMAHARLGIHSLGADAHFRARALWRVDELAGRAIVAGHDIDGRRANLIHRMAGKLTHADPDTIESLAEANRMQAENYAVASTALVAAERFSGMTGRKEMTYLSPHEAVHVYGLLDGARIPRWLNNLVLRARESAREVSPHVSVTNRPWEGRGIR